VCHQQHLQLLIVGLRASAYTHTSSYGVVGHTHDTHTHTHTCTHMHDEQIHSGTLFSVPLATTSSRISWVASIRLHTPTHIYMSVYTCISVVMHSCLVLNGYAFMLGAPREGSELWIVSRIQQESKQYCVQLLGCYMCPQGAPGTSSIGHPV
jgi:hypothetical protein